MEAGLARIFVDQLLIRAFSSSEHETYPRGSYIYPASSYSFGLDLEHRRNLAFSQDFAVKRRCLAPRASPFNGVSRGPSPVETQVMSSGCVEQVQLLKVDKEDAYNGVIVKMDEPMDPEAFITSLRASISQWRQEGKKGVWIKLPIGLSSLVDPAVKEGFRYHHAEPDHLMLVYWIPTDIPSSIPANASHRVGIGAFVVNSERKVLVVLEKSGIFRNTGVWKLPTGVVDEGEDICAAAIREVREETGIETEFLEILAFRQSHQSFFTKSDLFFVCMLQPKSSHISKQVEEIEAAQWMPIEAYAEQPFVKENQQFDLIAKICMERLNQQAVGFVPKTVTSGSGNKRYVYCPK